MPLDLQNGSNSLLWNSLVTPNVTLTTYSQKVYYYIDDVSVTDAGPASGLCDCDDLDIDVKLFATHTANADVCCLTIFAKVLGQQGLCKLTDVRWRADKFNGEWSEFSVRDSFEGRFNDTTFLPIKTICADRGYDDTTIIYQFQFKTLGGEWSCQKEIERVLNCSECPCDWISGYPDHHDSTKNGEQIGNFFINIYRAILLKGPGTFRTHRSLYEADGESPRHQVEDEIEE